MNAVNMSRGRREGNQNNPASQLIAVQPRTQDTQCQRVMTNTLYNSIMKEWSGGRETYLDESGEHEEWHIEGCQNDHADQLIPVQARA